jgi:hypothetical protein
MRLVLVLSISVVLLGCASKPVSTADMKHPPDSRVISSEFLEPTGEKWPIIIKRDSEFRIMPCMVRILVDAVAVVDLAPGEGVKLYVDEGERFLAAHLCPGIGGGEIIELLAPVGTGKHATFRVSSEGGGVGISFQRTAF